MSRTDGALSGIRVIDFSQYYAGPVATYHLAMLGADVIKIEPLDGEAMRFDGADDWAKAGLSPGWAAFNLNKRSLALDVRTEQGRAVAARLIQDADVLCENFRPGVMARLGLEYATVVAQNPALVYCSVSGFGSTGPEGSTPAFDGKIQAMSGLMSISGDSATGPMRTGVAIADVTTGLTAAFAITAALHERSSSGEGQYVDVSMFEWMLSVLSDQVAGYTMRDEVRTGVGNRSVTGKPTGDRFATADGYLVLAVMTDAQYDLLLTTLELTALTDDPRFSSWPARITNGTELHDLIQQAMSRRTTDEWVSILGEAGIPFGPVLDVAQAVARPQIAHREFLRQVSTPLGPTRVAGQGFRLGHGSPTALDFAPSLGQHTNAILEEAGFSGDQIQNLRAGNIVR